MGIATGCMGMSLSDFETCTPSEFSAIYGQWQQCRQADERRQWEMTRMMCVCSLQPYSKEGLRPTDVIKFPWEAETPTEAGQKLPEPQSRDYILERYEQAKRRFGIN